MLSIERERLVWFGQTETSSVGFEVVDGSIWLSVCLITSISDKVKVVVVICQLGIELQAAEVRGFLPKVLRTGSKLFLVCQVSPNRSSSVDCDVSKEPG